MRLLHHPADDVIGVGDRHHHRCSHAALPGASRHRRHDVAGSHLHVRVGHHDQVVLGAAQCQHPLQVGGPSLIYDLGHLGGSHERHSRDAGVIANRFHRLPAAVHHLENALGETGFAEQFHDAAGAQRHQLRRLEDQTVAERDGIGDRPVRHHVREIERSDRGHHSNGIALDPALDPTTHLQHLAGGDLRQRTGELRQLRRLEHLGPRLTGDLAVFLRDQRRQ